MKSIRAWLMRRFDLADGDYTRTLQNAYHSIENELRRKEFEYKELSGRYELLEKDRLMCRQDHWRLAIQMAMNSLHKSVADNLANALLETDAGINPQVKSALEAWRDLSNRSERGI